MYTQNPAFPSQVTLLSVVYIMYHSIIIMKCFQTLTLSYVSARAGFPRSFQSGILSPLPSSSLQQHPGRVEAIMILLAEGTINYVYCTSYADSPAPSPPPPQSQGSYVPTPLTQCTIYIYIYI